MCVLEAAIVQSGYRCCSPEQAVKHAALDVNIVAAKIFLYGISCYSYTHL